MSFSPLNVSISEVKIIFSLTIVVHFGVSNINTLGFLILNFLYMAKSICKYEFLHLENILKIWEQLKKLQKTFKWHSFM